VQAVWLWERFHAQLTTLYVETGHTKQQPKRYTSIYMLRPTEESKD